MDKVEVKKFDALKERYGNVDVFLSHTGELTVISIPEWNWSHVWDKSNSEGLEMLNCIDSLSEPMFKDVAGEFAEEIHTYLLNK